MEKEAERIKGAVRERYGALARERQSCCGPARPNASRLYTAEELADLPQEAAGFSLGCGHPVALAQLQPGEVVLDLGSGGGLDCLLAAQRVGQGGKVIGLDFSPDMIELAKQNAARAGASNVEFRQGEMEQMPVETGTVDVIISNCVINLSPDKDAVFSEAFRVLKPGGRLSVSDIVLVGELPPEIKESLDSWTHCVAGALYREVYLEKLRQAGFELPATQESQSSLKSLPVVSLWVSARKPVTE